VKSTATFDLAADITGCARRFGDLMTQNLSRFFALRVDREVLEGCLQSGLTACSTSV
jgi:hypothetical protein